MECDYLDRKENWGIGPKYLPVCTAGPRPFQPNRDDLADYCKGDYTQCPKYMRWG